MANNGESVRRAREARGLTQLELARRAGISRQALGAIESGTYQPGVAVAIALSRELRQSVERLFGDADQAASSRFEVPWSREDSAGRTSGTAGPTPFLVAGLG